MSPWELICQHYQFPDEINGRPFRPEPKQIESINTLAPLVEAGCYLDMGTGKTFVSTACALYRKIMFGEDAVVMMPPNLIRQWARWLGLIIDLATGRPLTVTSYEGEPKKRAALSLGNQFILVGFQVWKRDEARFVTEYKDRKLLVLVDEANAVSNINSDIHQKSHDFCLGRPRIMLTGTPGGNSPLHAYGLIKYTSPGLYRSRRQFENMHVEKYDFFNKPVEWRDLPLLNENLMRNAVRVLYKDMYGDIEVPLYDPVMYDLDPEHLKLYRRLANDEMLKMGDDGKLDASKVGRLTHALGQLVVNWGHFAQDPSKVSAGIRMIEEKLEELGDGKMVIFGHYKMTIANLVSHLSDFGALAVNSTVSNEEKDANVQRFMQESKRRVIAVQYISGGKGLDGLQFASHTACCIEPCPQPLDFHQAIARLARKGQTKRVHVLMPVARRTGQMERFKALINNDSIVNQVVRNTVSLKAAIFGEEDES